MEQFTSYQKRLDVELSKYPLIVQLEQKCNVPKTYLVVGSVTMLFLMLFLNLWGQLLSNLVAWLYPGMY
jgi:receptor expression-enhancing protein 5/6